MKYLKKPKGLYTVHKGFLKVTAKVKKTKRPEAEVNVSPYKREFIHTHIQLVHVRTHLHAYTIQY